MDTRDATNPTGQKAKETRVKTATTKTQTTPACPACSSTKGTKTQITGVYSCASCGGVHGTCYKGDGYSFFRPEWHQGPDGETQYVDLTLLGSDGIERFHGWVNAETRRIVQVG